MSPIDWPPSIKPSKIAPENSVGIVIPMRDGMKFFKLAFYSVLSFTDHPFTLSVIDNMSTLKTRNHLRSLALNHPINVLEYDHEFNFSAQANLGLRYAFSQPGVRFGLVLNADAVVTPFWLSQMVHAASRAPRVGVVGVRSNIATPEQEIRSGPGLETEYETERVSGFCMMIRREAFEEVGGFDEEFKIGGFEDWDLCARARARGWRCVISTAYVHHFWKAFRRGSDFDSAMAKNKALFFHKHPEFMPCETTQTSTPSSTNAA